MCFTCFQFTRVFFQFICVFNLKNRYRKLHLDIGERPTFASEGQTATSCWHTHWVAEQWLKKWRHCALESLRPPQADWPWIRTRTMRTDCCATPAPKFEGSSAIDRPFSELHTARRSAIKCLHSNSAWRQNSTPLACACSVHESSKVLVLCIRIHTPNQ